ncbi:MAG: cytochrome b [Gammaproteobacteria bacterium]|nr:cytochrome b [Gammaproteobacteria bacterium]
MTAMSRTDRYHSASIFLHWLMLVLLAGVYAMIELHDVFPDGSPTYELFENWHFTLGLTVFVLVAVRLVLRLRLGTPPITPPPPAWQHRLSRLVHGLLYALMIGMPIGGWLMLSAGGENIPFYGLNLPPLIGPNEELAELIEEIHETAGTAGYWLIGLHALAALAHHYIVRDNTLQRMLPWAGKR